VQPICNRVKKAKRIQPSESELLKSVEHVVYEYANLVSAVGRDVPAPINTHLQDAFLLSYRKMADFFLTPISKVTKHDIVAEDFTVSLQPYALPEWTSWATAMNKQLAHITWKRDRSWDGSKLGPFRLELEAAWKLFLANLKPTYQDRFREEIDKKKRCPGFEKLDLG
jgi:hypothetical protein